MGRSRSLTTNLLKKENPMSQSNVTVDEWVALFRTVGLSDRQMHDWHVAFERRHPGGHQGFLEWLGLPAERIEAIRRDHGQG